MRSILSAALIAFAAQAQSGVPGQAAPGQAAPDATEDIPIEAITGEGEVSIISIEEPVEDKEEKQETEAVEEPETEPFVWDGVTYISSALPTEAFGWFDLLMGFTLGLYNPIQIRWRNEDCRSRFFHSAVNLIGYARHFDSPFSTAPGSLAGNAMQLTFTYMSISKLFQVCDAQYDDLENDDWVEEFGLDDDEETADSNGSLAVGDFSGVPDYLKAANILLGITNIRKYYGSHYHYYQLGHSVGSVIGDAFTGFDDWLDLGIITPQDPWERYNA